MKRQAFNPFLPCHEYVPDGEPHVFDGRLYLFGSHDAFNGERFCQNDYVCWSAPVDDLSDWQYHGIIYRKEQDPLNDGTRVLYAPDVAQGPDGRYYLYYTLDFLCVVSVAVASHPAGPYQYYGAVRDTDGHILGQRDGDVFQYDPGVLVDQDGTVHLYSGVACENGPLEKKLGGVKRVMNAAYHYQLAQDMLTVLSPGTPAAPGGSLALGTPYEGHAFFEASSIRRVGETYYFIYSSANSHELCYATSDTPQGPFQYGGVLVSIGDIGLNGRKEDWQADNHLGTTHGSIVEVQGQWYVFYHRQSNDNQLSRQACAEKIRFLPDGSIPQVEITSCGLNPGWLKGTGTYEARIACNLSGKNGPVRYLPYRSAPTGQPYYTQEEPDNDSFSVQYIKHMTNGSWTGFRYFQMEGTRKIAVRYRSTGDGKLTVSLTPTGLPITRIDVSPACEWRESGSAFSPLFGKQALFLCYEGEGSLDLMSLTLS
jgi:hypothetical protein